MKKENWISYLKKFEDEKNLSEKLEMQIKELIKNPDYKNFYELLMRKINLDLLIEEKTENLNVKQAELCDHIIVGQQTRNNDEVFQCIRPGCPLNNFSFEMGNSGHKITSIFEDLVNSGKFYGHFFGYKNINYSKELYEKAVEIIGPNKSSNDIMDEMISLFESNRNSENYSQQLGK